MRKVNLSETLSSFSEYWSPRVVAELNGQHVRLVKLKGEFVWHQHDNEDELFLVIKGVLRLRYREASGVEHLLELNEGEFAVVPSGTEHKPEADDEVQVLLFEPAATLNTGNVQNERTVHDLKRA